MRKTIKAIYSPKDEQGDFEFGNIDSVYGATERYFTYRDKPWFPITGELHFSRYDCDSWERELGKMRAEGLGGVSVYVFWNHHERKRGKFDFSGNNDIKRFLSICKKLGMLVVLRIGPWCHGEARYGGFPDYLRWVPGKRLSTPLYLHYVKRFWGKLYLEVKDFCDAKTIIAIQLENEYPFSISHINDLRKIAEGIGYKTPFFTMTAWPTETPSRRFVPTFGGYPEAPWSQHKNKLRPEGRFAISAGRSDAEIGADILGDKRIKDSADFGAFPYAGCEVGTGNQVTAHRRPIISDSDGSGVAFAKLASGMNWLGYYMYHGGRNPEGKPMQETRRTAYPNNYPLIDYDFQAPISKDGALRGHASRLRQLHLFLNNWDENFARTQSFFAEEKDMPYISLRAYENGGYIFISNYERGLDGNRIDLDIDVTTGDRQLKINSVSVEKGAMLFFPIFLNLCGLDFDYILAQPIVKIQKDDGLHAYFMRTSSSGVRLSLNGVEKTIDSDCAEYSGDNGRVYLHFIDAEDALKLRLYNDKILYFDGAVYENNGKLFAELYEGDRIISEGKCVASYDAEAADNSPLKLIKLEKTNPIALPYNSYMFSKGKRGFYRMTIDKALLLSADDIEVTLRVEALNVQIFHNGVLVDDYFNIDKKCVFRLARLKDRLIDKNELIIKTCAKTPIGAGCPYMEIELTDGCTDVYLDSVRKIKTEEVGI